MIKEALKRLYDSDDSNKDKIIQLYYKGKIDLTTLIDIIPLDLETLKQVKIFSIKQECMRTIEQGFESDIKYDIPHRYTLKIDTDQPEIKSLAFNISLGVAQVPWHYDKQIVCDIWTAQEFMQFYQLANVFVLNQRFKSDILELYIMTENLSNDEILSLSMYTILPEEYQNILVEKLTQAGVFLWEG